MYQLVGGRAEALEFIIREESEVTNIPLQALDLKRNLLVCAIHRRGRVIIPKGQDRLEKGDSVIIITTDCSRLKDISDILDRSYASRQAKAANV